MGFALISLKERRRGIARARTMLVGSKDALSDTTSDYAKQHQFLIDTYNDVLHVLDSAIIKAKNI